MAPEPLQSTENSQIPRKISPLVSTTSNRPGLRPHDLVVELRQLYQFQTVLRKSEEAWRNRYSFLLSKVTHETRIAKYFSQPGILEDPRNHCVRILDSFRDPILPKVEFLVMPSLRRYADPEFGTVGEVVDFVTQLIEGMDFMHSHHIAHGYIFKRSIILVATNYRMNSDLTTQNIMMDARPIIPSGWHFVAHNREPDGFTSISPLARIDHPVRYIIIDFDCSIEADSKNPPLILGFGGRDGDPPEYQTRKPYDPFKIDVFTLGNVFYKDLYMKYEGLDFLPTIIDYMKTVDFRERPTADQVMHHWINVRGHIDVNRARWRLQKRRGTIAERIIFDTMAFALEGMNRVKRMIAGET
ncbi:hypothetical protein H0H81_000865 [Sphagnurus paluster]|uniref:Protein kinase domain-containing protein n=1 Tax=Sphagnurus paluster TaxID=117069 RepID=A0A9P7GMG8_9AGAR|nr:hypothetical protein H0H81_000865 [Sphagnurus paluster]